MAQTLAESFLADLDELSDDEPMDEQEPGQAEDGDKGDDVSSCPGGLTGFVAHAFPFSRCSWTTSRPSTTMICQPWQSSTAQLSTRT